MCWSERVSLNTYIVAVFGTVFALMNGMPINIVVWLHIFSLMQLVEYFIWKNLHDPYWNQFFSSMGLLLLVIEPIASMFLMEAGTLRNGVMLAYVLFLLLVLYLYYPWKPHTKVGSNGHLQWFWQNMNMPFIFNLIWVSFFLLPIFLAKHYVLGMVGVVTVIITILTYNKAGTWGSMWCWIANTIWLFVIGFIAANKCFENLLCKK